MMNIINGGSLQMLNCISGVYDYAGKAKNFTHAMQMGTEIFTTGIA
jgi:hypothetical protein